MRLYRKPEKETGAFITNILEWIVVSKTLQGKWKWGRCFNSVLCGCRHNVRCIQQLEMVSFPEKCEIYFSVGLEKCWHEMTWLMLMPRKVKVFWDPLRSCQETLDDAFDVGLEKKSFPKVKKERSNKEAPFGNSGEFEHRIAAEIAPGNTNEHASTEILQVVKNPDGLSTKVGEPDSLLKQTSKEKFRHVN